MITDAKKFLHGALSCRWMLCSTSVNPLLISPLSLKKVKKNTQTTSAKETLSTIRKKSTWMRRLQIKTDIQLHSFLDGSHENRYEYDVWNKVQTSKETYQIQHFHWSWCCGDLDPCRLLLAATQSRNHNDMATEICFISRHANSSQFTDHAGSNLIWAGLGSSK